MMPSRWFISVDGDQDAWQDFCESFMSDDIRIRREWVQVGVEHRIKVTCEISIDPYQPIDSTWSMPSFIDQIGNRFGNIVVVKV